MISIDEALKLVDKEKVDLISKNLPSHNRYDSEQMTAQELHKYTLGKKHVDTKVNSKNADADGLVKIKRSSNGHFSGRHVVPVKRAKTIVKKSH